MHLDERSAERLRELKWELALREVVGEDELPLCSVPPETFRIRVLAPCKLFELGGSFWTVSKISFTVPNAERVGEFYIVPRTEVGELVVNTFKVRVQDAKEIE